MRATKDGECSCGSEIKECHIRWEHLETVMHQPVPTDRSPQDSTASAFPRYDRETGEFYRSVFPDAVTRGYHCPPVQQPYFNTVDLLSDLPDKELLEMIDHAYAAAVKKLPKKHRQELNDIKI